MPDKPVAYDPLDRFTRPDRQRRLANEVWAALEDGNLAPLADYLRRGYAPDIMLAELLADMIEGENVRYRLEAIGRPGERGATHYWDSFSRQLKIGVFIERRTRPPTCEPYKVAIAAAEAEFGIKRTAAAEALKFVRDRLARLPDDRAWAAMQAFVDYIGESAA